MFRYLSSFWIRLRPLLNYPRISLSLSLSLYIYIYCLSPLVYKILYRIVILPITHLDKIKYLSFDSLFTFSVGNNSPVDVDGPVSWDCRIHRLHLCREVKLPQRMSWHDAKQSDGGAPLMLELWGMQSTSLLTSLSGPLCPELVAPDRVLSMGQIELNCVLMLNWIVWNRTVLTFKLCSYVKLKCFKWNCLCIKMDLT